MFLVLTPKSSARLTYTLNFIFNFCYQQDYKIIHTPPQAPHQPVLEYAPHPSGNFPCICASQFLLETNISRQAGADHPVWNNAVPQLFAYKKNDLLGFDIFAATFYMLSRYEEYLPASRDKHGRFPAEASIAYRKGFLTLPVVDLWIEQFRKELLKRYSRVNIPSAAIQISPTFDVDNAFAYKHKPLPRQAGAAAKEIMQMNFKGLQQRIKVLQGKVPDPYANYKRISAIHKTIGLKPVFFFQLSNYSGKDKNISWKNAAYRKIITDLAQNAYTGIHPGYKAAQDIQLLRQEINRLKTITNAPVVRARFHYIRLQLPYSYRMLISEGIKEDHSMGFPDHHGFRAGTCRPFYFFDLGHNQTSNLQIFPFALMDATMQYYLKLSSAQVLEQAKNMLALISQTGGRFSMLWHNEAFSDKGIWEGWPKVYEHILLHATKHSGSS